jgi:hypothetical protein
LGPGGLAPSLPSQPNLQTLGQQPQEGSLLSGFIHSRIQYLQEPGVQAVLSPEAAATPASPP